MKISSLKEPFKSVENESYLKGINTQIEEVGFINARTIIHGNVLTIKGFGVIEQNDPNNTDTLEVSFNIPSIGEIYVVPVISQKLQIASDFSFEISVSDLETSMELHRKTTIGKQGQNTEIVTGTGNGYNIGKEHAFQVKVKHSQKSKPESTVKLNGLTITIL